MCTLSEWRSIHLKHTLFSLKIRFGLERIVIFLFIIKLLIVCIFPIYLLKHSQCMIHIKGIYLVFRLKWFVIWIFFTLLWKHPKLSNKTCNDVYSCRQLFYNYSFRNTSGFCLGNRLQETRQVRETYVRMILKTSW